MHDRHRRLPHGERQRSIRRNNAPLLYEDNKSVT